jgi:hypothetical protein
MPLGLPPWVLPGVTVDNAAAVVRPLARGEPFREVGGHARTWTMSTGVQRFKPPTSIFKGDSFQTRYVQRYD